MCRKIHVTRSKNGKWVVRKGLKAQPTSTFKTKSDAVKAAKKQGNSGGFVIVYNSDGKISEVRYYKPSAQTGKVHVQAAPVKGRLSGQDIYKAIATVELQTAG